MIINSYDFLDGYNVPPDATNVNTRNLPQEYKQLMITTGKWKLTIGDPVGEVSRFLPVEDAVTFVDEQGNFQQKEFKVYDLKYDVQSNKLEVFVDVKQNPIPLFVLYGAVAAVVLAVGAMSMNSTLEKVEQVTAKFAKNPFTLGILAIFLLPVIYTGYKMLQKNK